MSVAPVELIESTCVSFAQAPISVTEEVTVTDSENAPRERAMVSAPSESASAMV